MRTRRAILAAAFILACSVLPAAADPPRLKVSDNRRFLVKADGKPFFYLGDTAWELFHRLTREDAERYLKDRAAKGFTVIQAVVLAEEDGLRVPNAYGHTPLFDNDPPQPNEDYFRHVDWVVNKAAELGLYVGMLPTWGDKWNKKWGVGPEIFSPENAAAYGEWLGRRYRNKPIIWILGGDRPVETDRQREILRAMARGLRRGTAAPPDDVPPARRGRVGPILPGRRLARLPHATERPRRPSSPAGTTTPGTTTTAPP